MRIDKFLANCGLGSRSDVKILLKQKRVAINHKKVSSAKIQIQEEQDLVTVDGEVIKYEKFVYYLLNKPKGVISATEDSSHATVLDLLDETAKQKEAFPVGRLDIDTHGLLLITNNGALSHALLSPKKHVDKTYIAKVKGIMTKEDIESFEKGIVFRDGTKCLPASLTVLSTEPSQDTSLVKIVIKEGKFHQVKKMVLACGKEVVDLQRVKMGPLELDENLEKGEFRRLTKQELELFSGFGVEL
ncbi:ribosomal small subunit pseudouridine synthase A [Granulicatella balaenopterae]|uniref:Pseudouridine synthase n=1 Tax=Granulicatella balaenopterae TaxID=137733 RepID=A0A1H9K2B3_9LACT|nr:pseudouridine synthase [Granulicatella balaenopterae]SEQ93219.1 ribosomal small subunit pseudouridine synthase A [Granulicatella balaenopterae]